MAVTGRLALAEEGELLARGEVPARELQLALVVVGEGLTVVGRDVPALPVGERHEEAAALHDQAQLAAHLDEGRPLLVRAVPHAGAVVVDPLVAVLVTVGLDVAEDPHPLVAALAAVLVALVRLRLPDERPEAAGLGRADGEDAVVLAVLQVEIQAHLYPPSLGQLPDSVRVTSQRSAPQFLCRALSDNWH